MSVFRVSTLSTGFSSPVPVFSLDGLRGLCMYLTVVVSGVCCYGSIVERCLLYAEMYVL